MCLRRFGNTRKDRLSLLMPDSRSSPPPTIALRLREMLRLPRHRLAELGRIVSRKSMAWTGCKCRVGMNKTSQSLPRSTAPSLFNLKRSQPRLPDLCWCDHWHLQLLWRHQSTSEPDLWNLSETLRLPPLFGTSSACIDPRSLSLDELERYWRIFKPSMKRPRTRR